MEIEFHKLLRRQIDKYLTEDCKNHPQFKSFINAVNESYKSFERDKDLMDHVFKQSEEEYNEINESLKMKIFSSKSQFQISMKLLKCWTLLLKIRVPKILQSYHLMFPSSLKENILTGAAK